MSAGNHDIDNLYSKKFSEYALPVSDKVLVNIKKGLTIEKDIDSFQYWIWSIVIVSFATAVTVLLLINLGKSDQVSTNSIKKHIVSGVNNENHDTADSKEVTEKSKDNIKTTPDAPSDEEINSTKWAANNNERSAKNNNKGNNSGTQNYNITYSIDFTEKTGVNNIKKAVDALSDKKIKSTKLDVNNNERSAKNKNSRNNGRTENHDIADSKESTEKIGGNNIKKAVNAPSYKEIRSTKSAVNNNKRSAKNNNNANADNSRTENKKPIHEASNDQAKQQSSQSVSQSTAPKESSETVNPEQRKDSNDKNSDLTQNGKQNASKKTTDPTTPAKPSNNRQPTDSTITTAITDESKTGNKLQLIASDTLNTQKDSADTEKKIVAYSLDGKPIADNADEPKQNSDKPSFFLELNGGASLSYRTLSGNALSVASRNELEKSQLNYAAGMDYGMVVKNNYLFSIGIGIENKGEQYKFPGKKETGQLIRDSIPIYDLTGSYIIKYYTDTIPTETSFAEYKTQNKYKFIRLPIMIGYCFTIKEKWTITPIVGVNINYLLSANSSWFDPKTKKTVSYTKADESFSSFSIAGRIKLDVGVNLSDKWSIHLQPGYTRFFQSIYLEGDSSKLYPYSYDLNVGLRYKFVNLKLKN